MHAIGLIWVLVLVSPSGNIWTMPIGYNSAKDCEKDAAQIIHLIKRSGKTPPRYTCSEVSQIEEYHLGKH